MKGVRKMSLSCYSWGTSPHERQLDFPCDSLMDDFDDIIHRGVTIAASPQVIYRWLCQLRVASYAFKGKGSPPLIPGLENLAVGQLVMGSFEIVGFESNKHLTLRIKQGTLDSKLFGDVAVSYVIIPESEEGCRLLVRGRIKYPKLLSPLLHFVLPWGDLIMMRRQLNNFKKPSEEIQQNDNFLNRRVAR